MGRLRLDRTRCEDSRTAHTASTCAPATRPATSTPRPPRARCTVDGDGAGDDALRRAGGGSDRSPSASATLAFASEAGATFECRLDGAPFAACASPADLPDHGRRRRTRSRCGRATPLGNVDASPARRTWSVDAAPPGDGGHLRAGRRLARPTAGCVVRLVLGAGRDLRVPSRRRAWAPCAAPQAYRGLALGAHLFEARARDAAGNVDPSPATRSWTVAVGLRHGLLAGGEPVAAQRPAPRAARPLQLPHACRPTLARAARPRARRGD